MSRDIADIKTMAVVLRRTNYGEADRILNLITPGGKVAAIARGVRKARSKLAGGVEMFSLVEMNLHFGKGEFATVTGARMVTYYGAILSDYDRMELAALVLRKVGMAAEGADSVEYFEITRGCLEGLNAGMNLALVESWFLLNLMRVSGEEVNLYRDSQGLKLKAEMRYEYDVKEMAFAEHRGGSFGVDEIKLLRLMVSAPLKVVARVGGVEKCLPEILRLAKIVSRV